MSASKTIWITGASSGIGKALALKLAAQGHQIIASGRDHQRLEALRKEFPAQIVSLPIDVTVTDSLASAGILLQQWPCLDTVILNAGDCLYIDARKFSAETFIRQFETNVFGAVRCLELALPLLRKSQQPYIVGISSLSTRMPLPRAEAYGASKSALEYLLGSLRTDLNHEGFRISIVRPGFVKTPLTDRNDFAMPWLMHADQAAEYIMKGMAKHKSVIEFPGALANLLRIASWLPTTIQTRLTRTMTKRR